MGIGGEVGLGIGAFLAFLSVPGAGSWVKRNTYWVKRLTLGVRVLLKQKKIELGKKESHSGLQRLN